MKSKNPLFWELSAKAQAALMEYNWETYGEKMEVPSAPRQEPVTFPIVVEEDIEEIDKLMRQAPSTSRGKDG